MPRLASRICASTSARGLPTQPGSRPQSIPVWSGLVPQAVTAPLRPPCRPPEGQGKWWRRATPRRGGKGRGAEAICPARSSGRGVRLRRAENEALGPKGGPLGLKLLAASSVAAGSPEHSTFRLSRVETVCLVERNSTTRDKRAPWLNAGSRPRQQTRSGNANTTLPIRGPRVAAAASSCYKQLFATCC